MFFTIGGAFFAVYFASVLLGHPVDVAAWVGTMIMLIAIYIKKEN